VVSISCTDFDLAGSYFDETAHRIRVVVPTAMLELGSANARVTYTYSDGGTGAPSADVTVECANEIVADVSQLGIPTGSSVSMVDLQGTDVCGNEYRFRGTLRFPAPSTGPGGLSRPECS
jgi:hypothetical protein